MQPLQFSFDFLSPYAYLAWTRIGGLATRNGRGLEPVPVLLAAILGAHGQKGPAEIPAKRLYTFKDVLRKAHAWDVPIAAPVSLPFNPLLALRVASLDWVAERRVLLVDALYRAIWSEHVDPTSPAAVERVVASVGLDGARAVADAGHEDVKARLRRQTDDAIAAGVFGVPTVIADGELFWGTDSLEYLEAFLRGRDPIGRDEAARWARVPATAVRRAGG